jgi:hypothetical protein
MYIKDGGTVLWLTQVYLADPRTLRLPQVFHGWAKYMEADPMVLLLTQEPW